MSITYGKELYGRGHGVLRILMRWIIQYVIVRVVFEGRCLTVGVANIIRIHYAILLSVGRCLKVKRISD